MATKNAAANRVTANNLPSASLSGTEAGLLLPLAAQAALSGKAQIEKGKAQGASALAVMIAGFASDEAAAREWNFDMVGKDGQVKFYVECNGFDEFGGTEGAWRAEPKKAQTAYKTAFQAEFFNLPEPSPAVWTSASEAVLVARAIRAEGMTAAIAEGKLVLSGGSGERAEAMRAATSAAALKKIAKGEAGTNRAAPQNSKGGDSDSDSDSDTAPATSPLEITRKALALVKLVAKGEAAIDAPALENIRALAALVTANPEAFAAD